MIEFDGGREDNHDKPCIDIVYVYVFTLFIYLNPEVFIELLIGIVFFSNQLQLVHGHHGLSKVNSGSYNYPLRTIGFIQEIERGYGNEMALSTRKLPLLFI